MRFFGETIDGLLTLFDSQWHEIKVACSKYKRYVIEVREYIEAKEITYQQIKSKAHWNTCTSRGLLGSHYQIHL